MIKNYTFAIASLSQIRMKRFWHSHHASLLWLLAKGISSPAYNRCSIHNSWASFIFVIVSSRFHLWWDNKSKSLIWAIYPPLHGDKLLYEFYLRLRYQLAVIYPESDGKPMVDNTLYLAQVRRCAYKVREGGPLVEAVTHPTKFYSPRRRALFV